MTEIDMIIPDLDCGYEGMMVGISFSFRAGVIISFWKSVWKREEIGLRIARRYMNDIPLPKHRVRNREQVVTDLTSRGVSRVRPLSVSV